MWERSQGNGMNKRKPENEKRNVRMTISISRNEAEIIRSLSESMNEKKVHVLMTAVRELLKTRMQAESNQIGLFTNGDPE